MTTPYFSQPSPETLREIRERVAHLVPVGAAIEGPILGKGVIAEHGDKHLRIDRVMGSRVTFNRTLLRWDTIEIALNAGTLTVGYVR